MKQNLPEGMYACTGSQSRTSLDEPGEDFAGRSPGDVPRQVVAGPVDGAESRGLRSRAVGHVATRGDVHRRRRPDHLARVARWQYLEANQVKVRSYHPNLINLAENSSVSLYSCHY